MGLEHFLVLAVEVEQLVRGILNGKVLDWRVEFHR